MRRAKKMERYLFVPRPVFQISPRAVVAAAVFALAACAQPNVAAPPVETQPAQQAEPALRPPVPDEPKGIDPVSLNGVRVAIAVPLSGPAAGVGRDLLDAAQLALFDFRPENFELRVYDTAGNAVIAASAAQRAQQDGVSLFLGPLFADAVAATADAVRPAGIPIYAFSSDRLVAGDGVYVAGFFPEAQVARVVDFAARRGMFRFAVLVPNDAYGNRINTAVSESVVDAGGKVVDGRFYPPDNDGMTETVRSLARYDERAAELKTEMARLAGKDDPIAKLALERLATLDTFGDVGFEALILPEGGEQVLQLAPLLAFFDIDPASVKLLGLWIWDDPALGKEPSMLGAWFAAPPRASRLRFEESFRQAYGRAPDRLATLAYDGVALAAVLAQTAQPGVAPFARDRLENMDGFAGVDGIFRLHANGEVQRGLSVLEVQRDGPQEIDPAPLSFSNPPTN
jgi:branched-chain amino acid transport system substrate-binding protein